MTKYYRRLRWYTEKIWKGKVKSSFWSAILVIIIIVILIPIIRWALWPNFAPDWTGFGPPTSNLPKAKTLWDWMGLLIVPIALALVAIWFNNKARDSELKIATDRLQEEALQKYIDDISNLLLEHNLYKADLNDDMRFIARARTLSVLRQLDGKRKGIVLSFLHSADLIRCTFNNKWELEKKPIISLKGVDLNEVDVPGGALTTADITHSYLYNVNLSKANLYGVDLSNTVLALSWIEDANLAFSKLCNANLQAAILIDANLNEADLTGANLKLAIVASRQLKKVKSLKDCIMPRGEVYNPRKPLNEQVNDF